MLGVLRHFSVILVAAFVVLLGTAAFRTAAQDSIALDLQSELDIGFNCPVSSTLNPDQTQLWIVMDNCGGSGYSILIYDLASGTFIKARDDDFTPFFETLTFEQWVASYVSPFAYTANDTLELIFADSMQDYDTGRIVAPVSGDTPAESTTILLNLEMLQNLIPDYAGFPESTVYNADHTIAAVSDVSSIHILDLHSGDELFVIDTPDGSERYFPVFAPDGQSLYIPYLLNYDDMNDFSSSFTIYSLPDGAVSAAYNAPTPFFWPSPDNRFIAGIVPDPAGDDSGDSLLIVFDRETGNISPSVPINEPARHATECVNDGRSLADVDFTVPGDLPITSLIWLPDSSGFYTTNSFGGAAVGGGRTCYLDYSRLRLYSVQSSG